MTRIYAAMLLITITSMCFGQSISGKVVNAATNEPLSYVSIGVINGTTGTITDEKGYFKLETRAIPSQAQVRISMIGFEAQIFQLSDLNNKETTIRLEESVIQLTEVVIRLQRARTKTIGTKSNSTKTVTGWGGCGNCGEDLGGIERGIRINLSKPVFVEKVNFHVAYFGFDSMLVRLHIRKIENNYPGKELLSTNIYTTIKSTGWKELDLRDYNLSFSQDIAVTIEWVKAWGKSKDKENSLKFSVAVLKGTLFAKDGIEDRWVVQKNVSPGIYLTVEELE